MKRVLTAVLLVPFAAYSVLYADWRVFLAIIAIISSLCFYEYAKITRAFAPLGYVAGILLLLAPPREASLIAILTGLAAMAMSLGAADLRDGVARAGSLAMGVLYIFGAWKTAVLLHDMNQPAAAGLTAGRHWLMFGLMVNWIGDTGAYYVGRRWGKRKLAPIVSPGKTWEGAAASAVTGTLLGAVYLPWAVPGISLVIACVIALVTNAAGQIGDLAESALKRSAGVKDSGAMLPGHGGILDRLDSTLFAVPVLYVLVSLIGAPR